MSARQRHAIPTITTEPITAETLTAEQIREAQDRFPELVSSELAANALGLPESHTAGGLPVFAPLRWMWQARQSIALLLTNRGPHVEGKA